MKLIEIAEGHYVDPTLVLEVCVAGGFENDSATVVVYLGRDIRDAKRAQLPLHANRQLAIAKAAEIVARCSDVWQQFDDAMAAPKAESKPDKSQKPADASKGQPKA